MLGLFLTSVRRRLYGTALGRSHKASVFFPDRLHLRLPCGKLVISPTPPILDHRPHNLPTLLQKIYIFVVFVTLLVHAFQILSALKCSYF